MEESHLTLCGARAGSSSGSALLTALSDEASDAEKLVGITMTGSGTQAVRSPFPFTISNDQVMTDLDQRPAQTLGRKGYMPWTLQNTYERSRLG